MTTTTHATMTPALTTTDHFQRLQAAGYTATVGSQTMTPLEALEAVQPVSVGQVVGVGFTQGSVAFTVALEGREDGLLTIAED